MDLKEHRRKRAKRYARRVEIKSREEEKGGK
jgi:hypothetical protein